MNQLTITERYKHYLSLTGSPEAAASLTSSEQVSSQIALLQVSLTSGIEQIADMLHDQNRELVPIFDAARDSISVIAGGADAE